MKSTKSNQKVKAKFKNYSKYRDKYEHLVELERQEEMDRHEWEVTSSPPQRKALHLFTPLNPRLRCYQ